MSYTTYFEGTISYDRTFGDHKATAMLLYNQRVYNTNSGEGEYSVLPFKNLGLAGRATYSYKDRYFAEFNFGYNGSENFAPGKRFGFFFRPWHWAGTSPRSRSGRISVLRLETEDPRFVWNGR